MKTFQQERFAYYQKHVLYCWVCLISSYLYLAYNANECIKSNFISIFFVFRNAFVSHKHASAASYYVSYSRKIRLQTTKSYCLFIKICIKHQATTSWQDFDYVNIAGLLWRRGKVRSWSRRTRFVWSAGVNMWSLFRYFLCANMSEAWNRFSRV